MKLFKSLLVAPATLGLLAPIAATANEVTIEDFSPAEQLAITNSRVDGLEARLNNFEAGSFSETTTASFSVDFAIGAVDGKDVITTNPDGDEDLQAVYGFQIDLNTSFTGEDSLDVSIDAGNGAVVAGNQTSPLAEFDLNAGGDGLVVDGISYTFPLGGATAFVGDNTDGSLLFTTACVYGGPSNTLDDCANVTAGITGGGLSIGAAYDFDNGFTTAFGAQFSETGIATDETDDSYALNAAYTGDNYGVSLTYAMIEDSTTGADNDTYTAVNGYYSFDNGLNISAGYEIGDLDNALATVDETEAYFVGINGEVGPGELGAAFGTYGVMEEAAGEMPDRMMYEVYYSYAVNDGMTITPLIYSVEGSTAADEDETGIMVKTSFSF